MINGGLIHVGSHTAGTASNSLALSDGLACYTGSFSGVTSTSITHSLGSTDLLVEFKDSAGNLLVPDNWAITNPNVISADFSPAATGDVTIVACIESGLSPIRAGVLILEGLSGVIDLDSPNGSIDISTSGQVINLNAIFTPASGAVLEQKCRDIDILSGLIGTGGGTDAGQTSINGLSGVLTLTSPDNSILIGDNGQAVELSGLFTPGSGAILEQKCEDLITLSGLINATTSGFCTTLVFAPANGIDFTLTHGLGVENFTWNMWQTDLDPIESLLPINVSPSGTNNIRIQLASATSGKITIAACGGSGLGVTSLNTLQGGVTLSSVNDGLTITEVGQDVQLTPLFTAASGALIDTSILRTTLTFTPTSGTDFTLPHLLGIEDFTWNLWRTDVSPIQAVIPTNISPVGLNDVRIQLAVAASGKLVIRG